MDPSQRVTSSKSPAPPRPVLPAKPVAEAEEARSARPAAAPPRSPMPWVVATVLSLLLVAVLAVLLIVLLANAQGRVADAQAVAEAERRRAEGAAADERQKAAYAEGQVEILKREIEQLKQRAAAAQAEAEEARRQSRAAEELAKQRQSSLESELKLTRQSLEQARRQTGTEGEETSRMRRELAEARREIDRLRGQLADAKPPAPEAAPAGGNGPKILDDPGDLSGYADQIGKTFYFRVTGSTSGTVYGRDSYTVDSNLATAAVHAGVLKNGQTGVVRVQILRGGKIYAASTRHGVTTSAWNDGMNYVAYRVYTKD